MRRAADVAVLGAGLSGSLVALRLADAGARVSLFDRSDTPLAQASANNEGKVHLGLVYANDASGRTLPCMIDGALHFRPLLERWISSGVIEAAISDPFIYAVHADSLVGSDAVEAHFRRAEALFNERVSSGGGRYLGPTDEPFWRRRQQTENEALFDPSLIAASYQTFERSINPKRVCKALRGVLACAPRIELRLETEIEAISQGPGDRLTVHSVCDGVPERGHYDSVVNALWQDRLAIDQTFGIRPEHPVIHRYKVGQVANRSVPGLPTVTFMLGPFGDSVAWGDCAYLSWYPSGMLRKERGLRPAGPPPNPDAEETRKLIADCLAGLGRLMPRAGNCFDPEGAGELWSLHGGYITAWGQTGIEDRESQLHARHAVGVSSHGPLHSVETGKLTLAPLFAEVAAARVLGRESAFP